MRICFISEGCYPYVAGGVSGWMHSMIKTFPEAEFVIVSIITDRSASGKFVFELPDNVSEVHEIYLNDTDWGSRKGRNYKIPLKYFKAIKSLILNRNADWEGVFDYFRNENPSINDLIMGKDFYSLIRAYYDADFPEINFTDFLWTMRSVYLPLFQVLSSEMPKADIYHCVSTGYAGVAGCMARYFHDGRLLLSEHGIYTREREEELIKADWLKGFYKNIWIDHFKKMSRAAYDRAEIVTSLFEQASEIQRELGCPKEKQIITPNGINMESFRNIAKKSEDDPFINAGAFIRVTKIKDIKTMIQAFAQAKPVVPDLKLWIMGPDDEEPEYADECRRYVEYLGLQDVVFTGRIKTTEYIGKMDFTLLTSISEGQPLVILESFAALKPVIATDVGNCRGLIYGEGDDGLKAAGIVAHVMNVEEIAAAMIEMCINTHAACEMGKTGYRRLKEKYTIERMQETYHDIYKRLA